MSCDSLRATFGHIGYWLAAVLVAFGLSASAAHAADCHLSLDAPGVDFGRLVRSSGALPGPGQQKRFGPVRRTLSAVCDAPVHMLITFHGRSVDGKSLSFGGGAYTVRVAGARLDNQAVQPEHAVSLDEPPQMPHGDFVLQPTDGITAGNASALGKRLDVDLEITAGMPSAALRVADTTTIESDGAFDLQVRQSP